MMAAAILMAVAASQPAAPAKGGVLIVTAPGVSCKGVEAAARQLKVKPPECHDTPAPPPKHPRR